jgi:hypothetical protein
MSLAPALSKSPQELSRGALLIGLMYKKLGGVNRVKQPFE